jgi:putative addiction module component (TIGR02574 family)
MPMKPAVEEVVQKALELEEDERAEVASRLLDSLEQRDAASEAAWVSDLERRAAELESGGVKGVSWEELQQRLMRDRRGP